MADNYLPPAISQGRYPVRKVLGQGGMATVYRVHDQMLQVDRAIKVLSPNLTQNEKIRSRFLSEARTMARLKHPNIVGVFDVGMEGEAPFIVMEMIDGGSVMDWVNANGSLEPQVAAWITVGLLKGLQQAHENGIIHRDIKPHNLLLTRDGITKLTDFGIAHAGNTDMSLTRTGAVMGTMAYMSPEQRRNAKETGIHSDIYSSGATLYVLLKGEEPFDLYATDLYDELYAGMDEKLSAVIQKACAYKPEDRYQSAEEMRDAVMHVIQQMSDSDSVTDEGLIVLERSETVFWEPPDDFESDTPQANTGFLPDSDTGTLDFDHFKSEIKEPRHIEPASSTGKWIGIGVALLAAIGVGVTQLGGEAEVPAVQETTAPAQVAPEPIAEPAPEAQAAPEPVAEPEPKPEPEPEPVQAEAAPVKAPVKAKPRTKAPSRAKAPEPAAAPPPPPAPTGPVEMGRARINSRPWSTVFIDGQNKGTRFAGELPVGTHQLKLVPSAAGLQPYTRTINIRKDREFKLCWSFDDNAECPR